MIAQDLVQAVSELRPDYNPAQQLRVALLLSLQNKDVGQLSSNPIELERQLINVDIQLSATTDQHAAVSGELDSLASTSPCEFTPDHLWTLVRAIKVQSQILDLYLD